MKFIKRLRWLFVTRRPFRLTRAGWIFILYTIGVGAGAINTGNNLLYIVFGFFLGLLLASGVLSDFNVWGFVVKVDLPEEAEAGKPLFIPFTLSNRKKRIPALGVRAEWDASIGGVPQNSSVALPFIRPRASHAAVAEVRPSTRGTLQVTALRLTTTFPFGLLKKWWTYRAGDFSIFRDDVQGYGEVLVGPSILSREEINWQRVWQEGSTESVTHRRGEGTSLYGLRDYQPSDSPRNIHWKASARRSPSIGDSPWLVKEMEREEEAAFYFLWPPRESLLNMQAEEFEKFVQFAATFLKFSRGDGHPSHLLVPRPDAENDLLLFDSEPGQHVFFSLATAVSAWPDMIYSQAQPWRAAVHPSDISMVDLLDSFAAWRRRPASGKGSDR